MNEKYIRSLVKLTRVTSEPTLNAVIDHICNGTSQQVAADANGVPQESVARLNKRISELDKQVIALAQEKMEMPIMAWDEPIWDEGGKIHNWRNYVSDDVKAQWPSFTNKQKKALYECFDEIADREE